VHELRDLGCEIALDDFGIGYGGFAYLKRLPITVIKIDVEFVRDLVENPQNEHVVNAIVNLAQGFGRQTVAEGVENQATLELLAEYGVDYAQGCAIGHPAPIDTIFKRDPSTGTSAQPNGGVTAPPSMTATPRSTPVLGDATFSARRGTSPNRRRTTR